MAGAVGQDSESWAEIDTVRAGNKGEFALDKMRLMGGDLRGGVSG